MAENSQKHVSRKKSFSCCINTTGIVYLNPQLHFISVDSHRTSVREGPNYKDKTGGDKNKKYMEKI